MKNRTGVTKVCGVFENMEIAIEQRQACDALTVGSEKRVVEWRIINHLKGRGEVLDAIVTEK